VRQLSSHDYGSEDRQLITRFIRELLEAGANLHAVDHAGNTALHAAFEERQLFWTALQILNFNMIAMINNGAHANAVNYQGRTILHIAAATEVDANIRRPPKAIRAVSTSVYNRT
jgi:ankyrin repeat protein